MQIQNVLQGLKVAFLIIGTTIGAGFASGREIWEFFTSYGSASSYYLCLSMLLYTLCCYIILSVSRKIDSEHYLPVLQLIIGKRLAKVYDVAILLYLLSTTVVMFAGSGATLMHWSLTYMQGVVVMAILIFLVFLKDVKGFLSLNSLIIPILLISLISICIVFMLEYTFETTASDTSIQVFSSAIAFTSFNILPLVAVLSAIGRKMKPVEVNVACLVSGIGLCVVAVLYNQSLLKVTHLIEQFEIPLFAIIDHLSSRFTHPMTIVLWLAIFTTAISGMFGIISRITKSERNTWKLTAGVILIILPLTVFGFANLIKVLYPLYGMFNLFLFMMILLYPLSGQRKLY